MRAEGRDHLWLPGDPLAPGLLALLVWRFGHTERKLAGQLSGRFLHGLYLRPGGRRARSVERRVTRFVGRRTSRPHITLTVRTGYPRRATGPRRPVQHIQKRPASE